MVCVPDTTERVELTNPALSELSDEMLIARICKRDHTAFTDLLGRHLNSVHGYLLRLSGSRVDADDMSQETFLRVWQKASTFRPGRVKLTTWLHRIAHNVCVDEFRKHRNDVGVDPDELADGAVDQFSRRAQDETLEHLNRALTALPEGQRSALVLCQIQGFSNLEAATILNVSVRALESLLARARRRLKKELSEHTT